MSGASRRRARTSWARPRTDRSRAQATWRRRAAQGLVVTMLVALASPLAACRPPTSRATPPRWTTLTSARAERAEVTPPAVASEAPAAARPAKRGKEVRVVFDDPAAAPAKTVRARVGDTLSAVLPEEQGSIWTVSRRSAALGEPREDVEGIDAGGAAYRVRFTWPELDVSPGRYEIVLARVDGAPDTPPRTVTLTVIVQRR